MAYHSNETHGIRPQEQTLSEVITNDLPPVASLMTVIGDSRITKREQSVLFS